MFIAIDGCTVGDKAVADNISGELPINYLNGRDSKETLSFFIYLDGYKHLTYRDICQMYHVSMDENTQIIHVTGGQDPFDDGNYHVINALGEGFYHWGIIHKLKELDQLREFFSEAEKIVKA